MAKFASKDLLKGHTKKNTNLQDLIAPDKRVGKLVPIDEIAPNPDQPRKHFDEASLGELAESIRLHGLINPITVDENNMIVAGERRYRACLSLGMREVPVVRMSGSMEISLVENLQRLDLHPLEEAFGYQALVDSGNTHEQIAARIGKDRSVVSHSLRLLDLPEAIQAECVTSHMVSKDQLLQVLSAETEEARWATWQAIKDGKSARAIRRERKQTHKRPQVTPRVFINRVRGVRDNADSIDVSSASKREKERLEKHIDEAIVAMQDILKKLRD
jgi:ParB family transcriptional regulator, chromosome partitioning protein